MLHCMYVNLKINVIVNNKKKRMSIINTFTKIEMRYFKVLMSCHYLVVTKYKSTYILKHYTYNNKKSKTIHLLQNRITDSCINFF